MENSGDNTNLRRATFPKSERLGGRTAVDALFRDGESGFVYPFRYVYTISSEDKYEPPQKLHSPVRILFSVPKRYHKKANKRNLLKRRSREAYRLAKFPLIDITLQDSKQLRVALIYSSKEVEDYSRINNAVRRIISEIHTRV